MKTRVVIFADHEIVAIGLSAILGGDPAFETAVNPRTLGAPPDVVLYDSVRIQGDGGDELAHLDKQRETAIIALGHELRPDLAVRAMALGADGWINVEATARQLLIAVTAAARGDVQRVLRNPAPLGGHLLSIRETEVLAGITRGMSNIEISEALVLSVNSIKSYIRSAYRKIEVTTRAQAVTWCLLHGFEPYPATYPTARQLPPSG